MGANEWKGVAMRERGRWLTLVPRRLAVLVPLAGVVLLAVACSSGGSSSSTATGTPAAASLAAPFVIQADTVQGSKNLPTDQKAAQTCVEENRFPHNAEVVFRAKVIDPVTGKSLDDSALKSVVVQLPNGNDVAMKFGQHPASNPTDSFWAVSWTVPGDYPTGSVDWKIVATGTDGTSVTFQPFSVAPSLMTITDQSLPVAGS